jgi:gliding-associated putative ABC transporter substrate-binding component GldG
MSTTKTVDTGIRLVAIIGALIFVNIIGVSLFARLDLTRDNQYTLSRASRTTVRDLKDPLTVKAYFTKELPPPYSSNRRYVQDLLEEYYAAAGGKFRYEFIDPTEEETEADKEKKKEVKVDIFGRSVREPTSMEKELQTLGIPSVQVRVNEDDKLEVKRAYMGLALKSGDKTEVIPLVRETENLEYDLTSLIRKLTRERTPKVAFVTSMPQEELQKTFGRVYQLLSQVYEVSVVDLATTPTLADDLDAVIVLGSKEPLPEAQVKAIDAYVMSGRSAAFLLDSARPDLSTMQAEEMNSGLGDLLASYGVVIGEGLVLDKMCATINISQRRGFMTISQPVPYPFMPLPAGLDPDHPLTRGLAQVAFPFVGPLELKIPEGAEVKGEVLVRSSEESYVHPPPYNLDPFHDWRADELEAKGSKALVVTLSGALKSPFGQKPAEAASTEGDEQPTVATGARVVVVAGSSLAGDQFMSKTNEAFILNLLDWLLLDEDLLAVRSRGLAAAPLGGIDDEGKPTELSDGRRAAAKYGNMLGVPLAFVAFGLVRWRMREARRSKVTL